MKKIEDRWGPLDLARALEREGYEIKDQSLGKVELRIPFWEDQFLVSPAGERLREFCDEQLTLQLQKGGEVVAWVPYWTTWRALQHIAAGGICLTSLFSGQTSLSDVLSLTLLAQGVVITSWFWVSFRAKTRLVRARLGLESAIAVRE